MKRYALRLAGMMMPQAVRLSDLSELQRQRVQKWADSLSIVRANPVHVGRLVMWIDSGGDPDMRAYFGIDNRSPLRYWKFGHNEECVGTIDGIMYRAEHDDLRCIDVLGALRSLLSPKGNKDVRSGRSLFSDCLAYDREVRIRP